MNFAEYTEARRSKKWGIAVDDEAITRFVVSQPKTCPVCGCQVFDPFGMTVVIHDVAKCAAHNAPLQATGAALCARSPASGCYASDD